MEGWKLTLFVGFLLRVESHILEKDDVTLLHIRDHLLDAHADAVGSEGNRLAEAFRETRHYPFE